MSMSRDVRMSRFLGSSFPILSLSFSVFLVTILLCPPPSSSHSTLDKETELQNIFQLRNENDWKSAWHLEKHVRCRDQLLTHMEWACGKDVYKLDKKPKASPLQALFVRSFTANSVIKPWSGYVRRKRESKSITEECCSVVGCTWEEYAEYCPAHRRYRVSRSRS